MHATAPRSLLALVPALSLLAACGDDDGGNPADRAGIGAECVMDDDCMEEGQVCLTTFRGGYCGAMGCTLDTDCPSGAACVMHDDGVNYCFRLCADKPECNRHRSLDNEANCSSSITFIDPARTEGKACVPPSSGT